MALGSENKLCILFYEERYANPKYESSAKVLSHEKLNFIWI